MSGPFTTITVDQFHMLRDIYIASDKLLNIMSEFPATPSVWVEWIENLETAIDKYKANVRAL